jgi:hypothetical protein
MSSSSILDSENSEHEGIEKNELGNNSWADQCSDEDQSNVPLGKYSKQNIGRNVKNEGNFSSGSSGHSHSKYQIKVENKNQNEKKTGGGQGNQGNQGYQGNQGNQGGNSGQGKKRWAKKGGSENPPVNEDSTYKGKRSNPRKNDQYKSKQKDSTTTNTRWTNNGNNNGNHGNNNGNTGNNRNNRRKQGGRNNNRNNGEKKNYQNNKNDNNQQNQKIPSFQFEAPGTDSYNNQFPQMRGKPQAYVPQELYYQANGYPNQYDPYYVPLPQIYQPVYYPGERPGQYSSDIIIPTSSEPLFRLEELKPNS